MSLYIITIKNIIFLLSGSDCDCIYVWACACRVPRILSVKWTCACDLGNCFLYIYLYNVGFIGGLCHVIGISIVISSLPRSNNSFKEPIFTYIYLNVKKLYHITLIKRNSPVSCTTFIYYLNVLYFCCHSLANNNSIYC